jgi:hypothetical protein
VFVELQDYSGEAIDELGDIEGTVYFPPSEDLASFHLVGYVDPYGKAIFNHLQMEDFLEDLRRVRLIHPSEAAQTVLARIEEMAIRCKDSSGGLYLAFLGD